MGHRHGLVSPRCIPLGLAYNIGSTEEYYVKEIKPFAFKRTPRISLSLKLVPVQNREDKNGPFMTTFRLYYRDK